MTARPQRIRLSRAAGWKMPAGAVSVARPTRWGNPFAVDRHHQHQVVHAKTVDGMAFYVPVSPGMAVELFRWYVTACAPQVGEAARHHLAGRDLACWCPIGQPCHADVLLELANRDL